MVGGELGGCLSGIRGRAFEEGEPSGLMGVCTREESIDFAVRNAISIKLHGLTYSCLMSKWNVGKCKQLQTPCQKEGVV